MPLELSTDVKFVKGVGPHRAESLKTKNIETVEDLLYHLPFRYEDRLNARSLAELKPGEMASIIAEVRGAALFRTRRMPLFQVTFGQGRSSLKAIWFNQTYLKDKFKAGQLVALYGKVEGSNRGRGGLEIRQPQFEIISDPDDANDDEAEHKLGQSLEIGRIVPIYETADKQKLTSRWFRNVIWRALENLATQVPDGVPAAIRKRLSLIDRRVAFQNVHFPPAGESFALLQAKGTPAHFRLIFEELFFLEIGLELKRAKLRSRRGIPFAVGEREREAIKRFLPFHPTAAQKRVLKEIAEDMQSNVPMRRLLQGDVGSGKTIVALQAAVIAIENGHQAALMAPTEILATQHYLSARRLLEPLGYRVVLLTGSQEADRKREIRRHIAHGHAQLVIGTHALIQEKVEFAKIGLVVVDEQHRFGVMQRFRLMKKSAEQADPDTLVMTATPIPRTLALTLYGDLDTSILDELPPGRTPITTRRVSDEKAADVWEFVRKQVKAGHQAYVVYPVIEAAPSETEEEAQRLPAGGASLLEESLKGRSKLGLKAAVHMYDELRKKIFPDLRVALLHGRMEAEEKDEIMRSFKERVIDVLVATTVIEVGVDVPNANIMVIEHAERFGLSQLHQLRGRIGRGAAKSYCVLMTDRTAQITPEGEQRLNMMVQTQNGFEIAELDLELRGPGEFFGTRQAGMPQFRVASLLRDKKILELAKREAEIVVAGSDPAISKQDVALVLDHLKTHWQRRYGLVEVG
jgi:ATP-dependent DNA helicase RecG